MHYVPVAKAAHPFVYISLWVAGAWGAADGLAVQAILAPVATPVFPRTKHIPFLPANGRHCNFRQT
jgi:hypothetical protein